MKNQPKTIALLGSLSALIIGVGRTPTKREKED
jgi:hypothetical protein